jgi:Dullard-like phosphatase family protein
MFSQIKEKKIFHEYSVIFIFSLGTIFINNLINYDTSKNIILLNLQQKLFLLFCDAILKKLNSKYNNNIWVNKLLNELNNKLIFNIYDNLFQIRLLSQNSYQIINEILMSLKKYIQGNYYINNNIENLKIISFLYDCFYSKEKIYFDTFDITVLEELFNNNIFNHENKFSKNNILSDINCINNEYYNNHKYNKIDTKIPYLKFPCQKEYTLILDLDETLICFKSSENDDNIGNIHIRPGLEIFLEIIKEFYEIIIFTVGTREYANIILDLIEKKNNTKFFDGRLYREHATKIGNKYIKDLSKIGRDLSRTLIVDNNPHSFKLQHDNGILISSYFGEKNDDKALIELQKVLIKIYKEKGDIRESITKYKEEIIQKISCSN